MNKKFFFFFLKKKKREKSGKTLKWFSKVVKIYFMFVSLLLCVRVTQSVYAIVCVISLFSAFFRSFIDHIFTFNESSELSDERETSGENYLPFVDNLNLFKFKIKQIKKKHSSRGGKNRETTTLFPFFSSSSFFPLSNSERMKNLYAKYLEIMSTKW